MSSRKPDLARVIARLNEPQRRAVTCVDGPLLVLAGAGTGKTRVVTVRLAHLLAQGAAPKHLLAVTFTNKAAREMRERVAGLVGAAAAKELSVTTFHSFALGLLKRFGEHLGLSTTFTIADDEDRALLLRTALRELGVSEERVSPRWGLSRISAWKNDGLFAEDAMEAAVDAAEIDLAHAYARMAREMLKRQTVDFDDMILFAGRLLAEHPDVLQTCRDRWRWITVDEFQDTNATQLGLVRALAGARRNVCVVGDDDQSIYGWRGAIAGAILDFSKHFPGATVVTLEQNYRSTNAILRLANAVIRNNGARLDKKLWSDLGEGEPIELFRAADEREEMTRLVVKMNELASRGVPWKDMAVLFRANAQSNAVELRFRERGIPYKVVGTWSLFDKREVRDVLAYLKVLANPRDDGALLRILNRPSRGIGNGTRDRLMERAVAERRGLYEVIADGAGDADLGTAAVDRVAAFRDLMARVRAKGEDVGVRGVVEALLEEIGYRAFLETESRDPLDAQVRWNIVESLLDLAQRFDEKGGARGAEAILGFLEMLALDQQQKDRDGEDETSAVTLLTVHAAKGLEFPHVFVIGVEEGLFPHRNALGDEEACDSIDEERRLFYVAVTRARQSLHLSLAAERRRFGRVDEREESRFIAEAGDAGIRRIDAASEGPAPEASAASFLDRLKNLVGNDPRA